MNITNKKNNIIDAIQSARSKNNKNWMDLLRLSLKLAPNKATKILKNINTQDKKISKLLNQLGK